MIPKCEYKIPRTAFSSRCCFCLHFFFFSFSSFLFFSFALSSSFSFALALYCYFKSDYNVPTFIPSRMTVLILSFAMKWLFGFRTVCVHKIHCCHRHHHGCCRCRWVRAYPRSATRIRKQSKWFNLLFILWNAIEFRGFFFFFFFWFQTDKQNSKRTKWKWRKSQWQIGFEILAASHNKQHCIIQAHSHSVELLSSSRFTLYRYGMINVVSLHGKSNAIVWSYFDLL